MALYSTVWLLGEIFPTLSTSLLPWVTHVHRRPRLVIHELNLEDFLIAISLYSLFFLDGLQPIYFLFLPSSFSSFLVLFYVYLECFCAWLSYSFPFFFEFSLLALVFYSLVDYYFVEIEPSDRTITLTTIINCTCKITHKRDWIWSWTLNCINSVYNSQPCNIIGCCNK